MLLAVTNYDFSVFLLADLPPTYQRWGRAEGFVGAFMGILLIAAIFFMTTKPGLG